jgi:16S rRNA (guanine527-N7)-methyltransferase
LENGLRQIGIPRAAAVAAKLIEFGHLLLDENKRTNLTGARNLEELVAEHFLDSLAPLEFIDLQQPIVDLGSGAGLPGIPAAIAFPKKKIVLLEPRAKRAAFLIEATRHLALENTTVVRASAGGPGAAFLIGDAGTVLARAVGRPEVTFRLGLPLLRPGGQLALYEGRAARATSGDLRASRVAGGSDIIIRKVVVPGLTAVRHVWIVRKQSLRPGRQAAKIGSR